MAQNKRYDLRRMRLGLIRLARSVLVLVCCLILSLLFMGLVLPLTRYIVISMIGITFIIFIWESLKFVWCIMEL